ncbi:MAG: hypothetical protein WCD35_03785 [Mycobacteriales bacterium]
MRPMLIAALLLAAPGCGVTVETATPHCSSPERLAVVAQSVPTAAYLPCLRTLPQGWSVSGFDVARGSSRMSLLSDRSGGRPVEVTLTRGCDVAGASPTAARDAGVRSYVRLRSVSPTYAGTLYDVFAGGCVRFRFAFPRGPHIPLMEELSTAVGLASRRDLRVDLRRELGVELDP